MSFAKMVKNIRQNGKSLKILIMGLDNAGKTTVLTKYLRINIEVAPTFGYKIYSKSIRDSNITILDIGGQSTFRRFWTNYFEKTDGIVFVADCSDQRSFSDYLKEVLDLGLPTAVFFNKVDLHDNFSIEEAKKVFLNLRNVECFKISAIMDSGIEEGFDWLIKRISI